MANTYLLLRNNKETGPFTLDQLIEGGLKPYDLVWVSGKSAAWRYPSEVTELKPYAPIVEEQPFDRFFKKAEETVEAAIDIPVQPAVKAAAQSVAVVDNRPEPVPVSIYEPKIVTQPAQSGVKKSVFVSLPASAQKSQSKVTAATPIPVAKVQPVVPEIKRSVPADEPVVAEVKYSQPLDEIKEMYVKTLQDRRSKNARKGFVIANLKKAAIIAGILLAGVLAGFALSGDDSSEEKVLATSEPIVQQTTATITEEPVAEVPSQEEVLNPNSPAVLVPMIEASRNPSTPRRVTQSGLTREDLPTEIRVTKEAVKSAAMTTQQQDKALVKPLPSTTNETTGERSRKVRTEEGSDPTPALQSRRVQRNAWEDLVSVAANDYKRVAFGGIRNLQLTVTNNSKFPLENVTVQLEYIKPSEETLRTENVHFRAVGANETATIRIPDTNRGIRVNYRIVHVNSREMSESFANKD